MVKEFRWSPSGETMVQEIASYQKQQHMSTSVVGNTALIQTSFITHHNTTQDNKQRSITTHVQGWRNKGVYATAQAFYFSVDGAWPTILM
jgi:hypothetical protein